VDVHIDLLLDSFGTRWREWCDAARAAADAGFAAIWTYDHVDGRVYDNDRVLEGWTVLSALAPSVAHVMLGPLVLNVTNRHPGVLAAMAATLQDVSGGRLVLGLGAGARPDTPYAREQEAIGLPVVGDAERRRRVEWCVAELRRVWRTPGFLRPEPEPPVVIAALGSKMAELAGRVGDGINAKIDHPRLGELVSIARDAHRRAGRDADAFLVTVLAELDDAGADARGQLAALGVHRLVVSVSPPFDHERIAAAGHRLAG
jgi:alkanesulfonate monooxygenase SsuD/methylene tetrahydromethanopterin reductase-like flavin-dependent oxidoreductase (luciferase family)